MWSSICYNPLFSGSDLPFQTMDVMYITSAWPHACFNKITSFITAFITFERCICIAVPLKVKVIITPSRTKVIVLAIFVLLFALFSPLFYVNRLTWTFSPQRNATILAIRYSEEREAVETATFFIYSVAMSAFVIAFVFVCTLVLIVKLNSKVKWRLTSVANTAKQSQTVSVKDRKVVKMVALISTIFVICYIPTTLIFFMMAYEPQYSYGGRYENIYIVVWSVANVLETVNSSINFVVYYNMSSKFRLRFLEIFFRKDVG
ncbi:unnamed protein product [Lymnaea stagnalis]|uniref:G-protein coupled receptors family 1 profile domain-containing protein n=1 Tax=Lymnaea stagnalis TaxID=6523 RepID=A0AAV2H5N9_LYMST